MLNTANPAELKELDAMIERLRTLDQQISATERVGPLLDDRYPSVAQELDEAEAAFAQFGLYPAHPSPQLRAELRHKVLIGALCVGGGRNFLVAAGQERVKRQFEAQGGEGMTGQARELKLSELRLKRRREAATLEAYWRGMEERGLTISRPDDLVAPEIYLADQTALMAIAAGKEHSA